MSDVSGRVQQYCFFAMIVFVLLAALGVATGAVAQTPSSSSSESTEQTCAPAESSDTDTITCQCEAAPNEDSKKPAPLSDDPEAEQKPVEEDKLTNVERVERFQERLSNGEVAREDGVSLFNRLRDTTRMRLWQFEMALDYGVSTSDTVRVDPLEIEHQHPGFPAQMYQLPPDIVTVRDLYVDSQDLYWARTKALDILPPKVRQQAVGTALFGVQELGLELDLIVVEARYQLLRLPQAWDQITTMATQAPVPLIWIVLQFWLAIVLFRWWRRWLPALLSRMRSSFLAIRPRSDEIMRRLRGLWYVDQVRNPLEWLLLASVLFGLLAFDGIDLILEFLWIVTRWLLLGWFAVEVLNAVAARGAGGLAGDTAKLRLSSMRLVAAWLVLLGLGLELSNNLVGNGSLAAWVWRVFQLLAFPLILRLLSIWHDELQLRLQRENDDDSELAADKDWGSQWGPQRWINSAKAAGVLMASYISSSLLRRIEQFDPVRKAASKMGALGSDEDDADTDERERLSDEQRTALFQGYDEFAKYGRQQRRELVARIEAGNAGVVTVVGERGIGRNGFLRQVADSHDHKTVFLSGRLGTFAALETELFAQLELSGESVSDDELNDAIESNDIRLIVISDVHLLMRPVMGGFQELATLNSLFDRVSAPVVWAVSSDRYAWQLIHRARASYSKADTVVRLSAWTDEQIGEFIDSSCESVELKPDFGKVKVPRRYMDTTEENLLERNKAGIYNMIASLSRGNPSIAIRLFGDAVRLNKNGDAEMVMPATRDDHVLEDLSLDMLLVLRTIAQCGLVDADDFVTNLRMDQAFITSTLHSFELRGWIELIDGDGDGQRSGYRLTWPWFRPVTRVLGRKNLLAGMVEESV